MFGQIRLWEDCNRQCEFCSLNDGRESTDVNEKRARVMRLSRWLHGENDSVKYDTFGLIGGELFCWSGLDTEWRCLADTIRLSPIKRLMIASNLLYDISDLIDFIAAADKPTTVCTSYDTKGRFKDGDEMKLWHDNMERLHNTGVDVCCTMIPTAQLTHDSPDIPCYVYINLCEPIVSCKWYFEQEHKDYHCDLIKDMKTIDLPRRVDMVRWMADHKEITKHYIDYVDTHSSDVYHFKDGKIELLYGDRLNDHLSLCGHQRFARCYADSEECMQCDAKRIIEERP